MSDENLENSTENAEEKPKRRRIVRKTPAKFDEAATQEGATESQTENPNQEERPSATGEGDFSRETHFEPSRE